MALLSMDVLRSFDSRLTLANVVRQLADFGVSAVLATGAVDQDAINAAYSCQLALLTAPDETSLTTIERAVNALILNQSARLTERAIEIQRQLTRLSAENRDLNSLLQVMARSTGKPVVAHNEAGAMIAQIMPYTGRRSLNGRNQVLQTNADEFLTWLSRERPELTSVISPSPLGYTTVLKVEKRVAGYLSLVDHEGNLNEFDRLVLTYGADVCAIEMAKNRAIASAVEQTRGDWIQMWLSGAPADDALLRTRAQQAGFEPGEQYVVAVYRALGEAGQSLPLHSAISLVRDDVSRRGIGGAVGQYVDAIVGLYPLDDDGNALARARLAIEAVRGQLAKRVPKGQVAAGISRPAVGMSSLREAYREAKDAVVIACELSDRDSTTFYGDLKLFQLLLALKERNLEHLQQFYDDALGPLVAHDQRKQSDLDQDAKRLLRRQWQSGQGRPRAGRASQYARLPAGPHRRIDRAGFGRLRQSPDLAPGAKDAAGPGDYPRRAGHGLNFCKCRSNRKAADFCVSGFFASSALVDDFVRHWRRDLDEVIGRAPQQGVQRLGFLRLVILL